MIIKAKPLPVPVIRMAFRVLNIFLRRRFNKLQIRDITIKPDHSYLLMCNHFSFWDGFWAVYLCMNSLFKNQQMKGFHFVILKKQLQMKPWLRYFGGFSIAPGTPSVNKSLDHVAKILSQPGNVVLMFPQGKLESNHVRKIEMKDGISYFIPKIKGDCQLIWSSQLIEYFESLKTSVYFDMLDCGTAKEFNFNRLNKEINLHHQAAIQRQLRFTEEDLV